MTESELKEKIFALALEWRELDELEPIPIDLIANKLNELAFAIDDYNIVIGKKVHSKKV